MKNGFSAIICLALLISGCSNSTSKTEVDHSTAIESSAPLLTTLEASPTVDGDARDSFASPVFEFVLPSKTILIPSGKIVAVNAYSPGFEEEFDSIAELSTLFDSLQNSTVITLTDFEDTDIYPNGANIVFSIGDEYSISLYTYNSPNDDYYVYCRVSHALQDDIFFLQSSSLYDQILRLCRLEKFPMEALINVTQLDIYYKPVRTTDYNLIATIGDQPVIDSLISDIAKPQKILPVRAPYNVKITFSTVDGTSHDIHLSGHWSTTWPNSTEKTCVIFAGGDYYEVDSDFEKAISSYVLK